MVNFSFSSKILRLELVSFRTVEVEDFFNAFLLFLFSKADFDLERRMIVLSTVMITPLSLSPAHSTLSFSLTPRNIFKQTERSLSVVNRGTISTNQKAARLLADQSQAREPRGEISYSMLDDGGRVTSSVTR